MIACPVDGCFRVAERWPSGPQLCIPHREEWAADHEKEITSEERQAWRTRNVHTCPDGEPFCTWPLNFRKDSGVGLRWPEELRRRARRTEEA